MRSDYGLYAIAIVCFIIAGIFAGNAVPGYPAAEALGLSVIIIFIVFGLVSLVVGYSSRPKAAMPTAQPVSTEMPPPQETIAVETSPAVAEEETPPTVAPIAQTAQPAEEIARAPMPSEEPMPAEPTPSPAAPAMEPEQPEKGTEEEVPREKPVRRRRKKAQ